MRVFALNEAEHFCRKFEALPGAAEGSIDRFMETELKDVSRIKEGTPKFKAYRACSLRNAERSFFLAASNYRRSLDLMTAGAVSWGHVTLYYSSFFAASAVLGMLGGWIGSTHWRMEVAKGSPGQQELALRRDFAGLTTRTGSHQIFWEFYYAAMAPLVPVLGTKHLLALRPVSSDPAWQISKRNKINYDYGAAFELLGTFQSSFSDSTFPACLPGELNTQFKVTEAMLVFAAELAKRLNLETDALANFPRGPNRQDVLRAVIFDAAVPALTAKSQQALILA